MCASRGWESETWRPWAVAVARRVRCIAMHLRTYLRLAPRLVQALCSLSPGNTHNNVRGAPAAVNTPKSPYLLLSDQCHENTKHIFQRFLLFVKQIKNVRFADILTSMWLTSLWKYLKVVKFYYQEFLLFFDIIYEESYRLYWRRIKFMRTANMLWR